MMYLYHFVPEDMRGTVLYSLNEMKYKLPELFDGQAAKYEGREDVKDTEVPGLGNWNSVIHLSPIDPTEVKLAMQETGAPVDMSWRAFRIDASSLDQSKMTIMVTHKKGEGQYEKEYLPFTEENYLQNNHLPEITKQHYRDARAQGEQPLTYAGAPHVLYLGTIETKDLEVVSS